MFCLVGLNCPSCWQMSLVSQYFRIPSYPRLCNITCAVKNREKELHSKFSVAVRLGRQQTKLNICYENFPSLSEFRNKAVGRKLRGADSSNLCGHTDVCNRVQTMFLTYDRETIAACYLYLSLSSLIPSQLYANCAQTAWLIYNLYTPCFMVISLTVVGHSWRLPVCPPVRHCWRVLIPSL